MAKRKGIVRSVEDRLRQAGVAFQRLDDVPPKVVREVMRGGFANMRMIELPPATIRSSLKQPLLGDLLVTRIGFTGEAAGHYIPRPEGSLDHILIHCVRGAGWLQLGGRRWKVAPDTVLCIPAGKPHWYGAEAEDPWSIYWLHLTGRRAGDYFKFLGARLDSPLVHVPHVPEVLAAFEATWAAMKAVHTPENLIQASVRAAHFLGLIQCLQRSERSCARASEEAIRQSIGLMNKSLGADITLGELAELAGMSVTHYTVCFRKTTGCSPKEYFNRLKVQRACELLRTSDTSVRGIARELGFSDPYYFSHAFKRIAGMSPEKFRRN